MPGYGWSCPVIPGTFGRHGRRGSNLWSASSSPVVFRAAIGGGWNPRDRKRTRVKTARGGAPPTRNRRGVRDAPREPAHGETPAGPMPMTLATGPRRGAPGAGRPCHRWLPPVLLRRVLALAPNGRRAPVSPAVAPSGRWDARREEQQNHAEGCVTGGCPVRPAGPGFRPAGAASRSRGGDPIQPLRAVSVGVSATGGRSRPARKPPGPRRPQRAPRLARGLYCVPDMRPDRTGRGNPNGSACERTLLQS